MRILLDECIDESFRHHLSDYECQTCRYAGFKGLDNGKLIAVAAAAGFDVLVTVDQHLPSQQNASMLPISVLVLQGRSTNIEDLIALLPAIRETLKNLRSAQVIRIGV